MAADAQGRRSALLLGIVIVFWGCNWPIIKLGLIDISPLWFAAARLGLGAACMFAASAARGGIRLPPRADLPVVLSVALLQFAAFLALAQTAMLYVPAGRSSVLAYTTPIWVVPLAWIVLGERLDRARWLSLAFGTGGLIVLFSPLGVDYADIPGLIGNGLLLLAALAWAVTIVHVRAHRWLSRPFDLIPWQMLLAAIIVAGVAAVLEPDGHVRWTVRLVLILAYNGVIASAFCFWAFITVNRSLSAATTALASLGVPAIGLVSSAIVVGEPLTLGNVIGLLLILAGTVCLIDFRRIGGRQPPPRAACADLRGNP